MNTLASESLNKLDAYWRAANYLSVGQMYLRDNPLLREPLKLEHVKRMLLGQWGTTPGQNFIYAHLNRVINKFDLDMIYISGPGHDGPAVVANTYLEGSYSEVYPNISQDEAGPKKLFTQFSFPGGIPGHASPECPSSSHEGGELGYSLSHAFGAVFDEPFTADKPIIFAFHGYPWLIHRLTYRRTNHDNIHVRGYKEEGTITTAFDMTVLNELDRFHLVMDAIHRLPQTGDDGIQLKRVLMRKLIEHKKYIEKHGEDLPEIRNWKWQPTEVLAN